MIACRIELAAILQAGSWKTTPMVHRYGERLLAQRSGALQERPEGWKMCHKRISCQDQVSAPSRTWKEC